MKEIKWTDILETGLATFKRVLDQGVTVNRQDMADLINFETALTQLIGGMRASEGKSFEELLQMKQEFERSSRESQTTAHLGDGSSTDI